MPVYTDVYGTIIKVYDGGSIILGTVESHIIRIPSSGPPCFYKGGDDVADKTGIASGKLKGKKESPKVIRTNPWPGQSVNVPNSKKK